MNLLKAEIRANASKFAKDWRDEMSSVDIQLQSNATTFVSSYERITSLQAWRSHLEEQISPGSLAFFLEAQNDALTSHVFASLGSWRSALKALRGAIDNTLFCLYYKDHPVELQLWSKGEHKPTFSELFTYLDNHPARLATPTIDSLPDLRNEYSTLSKAVHASSITFRMTKNIKETLLWSANKEELGKWETRERAVIQSINLLLLSHYRHTMTGAAAAGLRDVMSLAISPKKLPHIAKHFEVVIHPAIA